MDRTSDQLLSGSLTHGIPLDPAGPSVSADASGVAGAFERSFGQLPVAARAVVFVRALVVVPVALLSTRAVSTPQQLAAVALPYVLLLAGLVFAYKLTVSGDVTAGSAWSRYLDRIGGEWWQLVISEDSPGLTHLTLTVTRDGRCAIAGRKWRPDGRESANWSTDVTALKSSEPVSVFYYWTGSYAKDARRVSGVGVFDFSASGEGSGWFTTGDVERGEFGSMSTVHLRRLDDRERRVMGSGDARAVASLVRSVHADWSSRYAD